MAENSIVGWVIAGGGGTLIGSLVMSMIQTFGKHGRDRAEAADLATTAAAKIIERLEEENLRMRTAIVDITQILDTVISELPASEPTKARLRKANKAAKLAAI